MPFRKLYDGSMSNHPQSLWISLWTGFRGVSQVTYRKGFFFGRSKFELSVFSVRNQWLAQSFPLEPDCSESNDDCVAGGLTGGG